MDEVRRKYLINVYQNQQATPEEKEELLRWYREVSYQDGEYPDVETAVELRMLSRLLDRTGYTPPRPLWQRLPWKAVAAAVLILTFLGSLYYLSNWGQKKTSDNLASHDIAPGSNRAKLVLADGKAIDLSSEQAGIVVDEKIAYLDGSAITDENITYATLVTPRGGQYQIVLSDGTKIWLNAASKLKYPSRFEGDERIVELEGEAFFDVKKAEAIGRSDIRSANVQVARAKKYIPFIVKTPKQVIEVLGTQFNVSAYTEDHEERTTLVEGRVKVAMGAPAGHSGNKDDIVLNPNQQSVIRNGQIVKSDVDVHPYVSWKDGRFSFEGKTFAQVMNELSRWYAIDVVYKGSIPQVEFYGGAYRSNNLSLVLRMMQSANLQYTLNGRELTISTKGKR